MLLCSGAGIDAAGDAPVTGSEGSGLLFTGDRCCGCRGPFKDSFVESSAPMVLVCLVLSVALSCFGLES